MPLYRAGYTLGEIGERNAWPKSPGGREVEIDSKPHTVNQGNGCFRHDDCFTCPLEECLWELSTGGATYRRQQRDAQIRAMRAEGYTYRAICADMGITASTVARATQQERLAL